MDFVIEIAKLFWNKIEENILENTKEMNSLNKIIKRNKYKKIVEYQFIRIG